MHPTLRRPGLILSLAAFLAACQGPLPEATPIGSQAAAGLATSQAPSGDAADPARAPSPGASAAIPQGKGLTFLGITERDGKALGGAEVTVLRMDTNQAVATATTYADGSFAIQFGADLPPTLPIKVVAKKNGEALGAVVAGGPLAIIAGGAGNIIAGGAGNIIAGGAGNVIAAGAGNIIAGGAGNVIAGGAGNIIAGGAGNLAAGLPGASLDALGRAGSIIAGGAGNVIAGGAANIIAGGAGNLKAGNVLSGGAGNVIVAAPASMQAATANGIIAGGAGNIIAGGAGNIIAGGAGNIIAGGAGNYRLSQSGSPQPSAQPSGTIPAIKLSLASTAAVLILEKRVRAYAQATGQSFIQAAAVVADAVFEGLTGFLATSGRLATDEAAQRLLTTALADEATALPPTLAANLTEGNEGLNPTILDAAVRLGLVILGTATATDIRPSTDVLQGYEVGNNDLPPVDLPASVGTNAAPEEPQAPARTSTSGDVVGLTPGQNPVNFPLGGAGAIGNPGLSGPGPQASSFPGELVGFSPLSATAPGLYDAACFTHGGHLYVVGGSDATHQATHKVYRATLSSEAVPGTFTALADLPASRAAHGLVVQGDKAYLFGGRDETGAVSNRIFQADLSQNAPAFTAFAVNLSTAVAYPAAVATGQEQFLVLGGTNAANGMSLAQVIKAGVPNGNRTLNLPNFSANGFLGGVAIAENNHVAYFGGANGIGGTPLSSGFSMPYTPADGEPTTNSISDLTNLTTMGLHGGAVFKDGKVFVVGGRVSGGAASNASTAVQRFALASGAATSLTALSGSNVSLFTKRSGHAVVLVGTRVLVLGGRDANGNVLTSIERASFL